MWRFQLPQSLAILMEWIKTNHLMVLLKLWFPMPKDLLTYLFNYNIFNNNFYSFYIYFLTTIRLFSPPFSPLFLMICIYFHHVHYVLQILDLYLSFYFLLFFINNSYCSLFQNSFLFIPCPSQIPSSQPRQSKDNHR